MRLTNLPWVTIEKIGGAELPSALMALGGRPPAPSWLSGLKFDGEVWAVDRGIDICRAAGIVPQMLIGDGDSATREGWLWAEERGVPIRRYQSDKDLTDFQLALDIFRENNKNEVKRIFLTGAFGGRFDHLWSTAITFLNFSAPHVPFCAADDKEGLLILREGEEYSLSFQRLPEAVSLISFSEESRGVRLEGVRWPLDGARLSYGFPYAVSNRLNDGRRAKISCESGRLGLYWAWSGKDIC
ncbi:MAG: thiamine diphosphokinase [Synergistaceae bacterium]|nr:thiamine diphosphokinase [Synergistaceae bacterium]